MKSCKTSKESCIIDGRNVRLDLIKGVSCFLIVFLHNTLFTSGMSISNSYDVVAVFLHTITRVAVPAFMGISGYFLFFFKDRPLEYGWKNAFKYIAMLLIWEMIYNLYNYYYGTHVWGGVRDYLADIDITCGHLWYLKLLIMIMLVFPVVNCIVMNKKVLNVYCIFWSLFFSLRFTVGILGGLIPEINSLLKSFQIPFFEYGGYVGGTVGSERPTTYMGAFIIIGVFIWFLEANKLKDMIKKVILCLSVIGYVLVAIATTWYSIKTDGFCDYLYQPVEVHIIIMTLGFLTLFYYIPSRFLAQNAKIIGVISKCSLGIYILHPLVGNILRKLPVYADILNSERNILLINLFNWATIVTICFFVVLIIKSNLPGSISKYIF